MRQLLPLDQADFPLTILSDEGMEYPSPTSKQRKRFAVFNCPFCGNGFKSETTSVKKGRATKCKSCHIRIKTTTHGETKTRLHSIWVGMRSRCRNLNAKNYQNYGGRGITICDEWDDFITFKKWALLHNYLPSLSIDREDNDKGYSPENCRWVTRTIQSRNTRILTIKNTSGYRGVYLNGSSYIASIGLGNKTYYLGSFKTKEQAAIAYDTFVIDNSLEHTINGITRG